MNVHIKGADTLATNKVDTNYAGGGHQYTTAKTMVFGVTLSVLSGTDSDRFLWLYDLAAGATTSKGPVAILACPAGMTAALPVPSTGMPFHNGVYGVLVKTDPADADTAPVANLAAANEAIVTLAYRNV